MRTFISIDLPDEICEEVKKIQEKLPEFYGKKIELENLHLTLKFLGEIDEKTLKEVKERLKKIDMKGFDLSLGELGVFSPKFIRIIWIKLNGAEELQKAVDGALEGLFKAEKRFMSHLTIGRVKKVNVKRFLQDLKKMVVPDVRFKVDNFKLNKSTLTDTKAIYELLEEYKLS